MGAFGFSTGALALGDFRRALAMLRDSDAEAVELSALRERELPALMKVARHLPLDQFRYVSVHAPSRFSALTERQVAALLLPCIALGWRIVVHPDAIVDYACWRPFGPHLCIENMDKRKPTGRTAAELRAVFEKLPDASLCLDLAHARQIDTTLSVARLILAEFGTRLAQIHLSELDYQCRHAPLSMTTIRTVQQMAHWFGSVPVILESQVPVDQIRDELRMARLSMTAVGLQAEGALRA